MIIIGSINQPNVRFSLWTLLVKYSESFPKLLFYTCVFYVWMLYVVIVM